MSRMPLVGVVCLLAGMSGATSCAAGARETGEMEEAGQRDGAIKGAQSAAAYFEAVLVNMLQEGRVAAVCSGALIAPRVVLTAGHCVQDQSAWEVVSPWLGESTLVDFGEPYDDHESGGYVHPASHDVGLLRLTTPLELPAYPALADEPLADGSRVVSVGRVLDGAVSFDRMFASKPVRVRDGASVGFPYAYRAAEQIESGDSGGPAFVVGTKSHVIAAVSSGGGGGVELLARVDLVRAWIADWTAAYGGAAEDTASASQGDACEHSVCSAGDALDPACDPCVATVCEADGYCCDVAWDEQCASEASSYCGACGG
jgi:hypothetical protein